MIYKPTLDIRMVRGPRTRDILLKKGYNCPEVYGDPAILMPMIYYPKTQTGKRDYSVILHKSDDRNVPFRIETISYGFKDFIDQIVNSKLIISSSLHGIILAESYGTPAILLNDSRMDFNMLKYEDYYFSTDRMNFPVAYSIESALQMDPPSLPNRSLLKNMRETMIKAFPRDLWE
ncbi:MAG: polysaccharide pyruvyl transferase family protein [Methanosphaera sp.]|nr:polysaccharide pyruvyl transferase family protein [Methanosphaera sp.]